MKYAVYVEGQSELLFVADVLQKYSGYDPVRCGFLCINLSADDFEQTVFHPYPLVKKIYQACGEDYGKHGSESFSFLSTLSVEDYEGLRHSGRCASFAKFLDSLLGGPCPQLP